MNARRIGLFGLGLVCVVISPILIMFLTTALLDAFALAIGIFGAGLLVVAVFGGHSWHR